MTLNSSVEGKSSAFNYNFHLKVNRQNSILTYLGTFPCLFTEALPIATSKQLISVKLTPFSLYYANELYIKLTVLTGQYLHLIFPTILSLHQFKSLIMHADYRSVLALETFPLIWQYLSLWSLTKHFFSIQVVNY